MAIVVVTAGAIFVKQTIQDVRNPKQIAIPNIGKNPPFKMEAVPISKIGKKKSTFKELW